MSQVGFDFVGPAVKVFHPFQPAAIVKRAAELAEPWTHAVGDSVEHPYAYLGVTLNAVFPAIRFFKSDTEQANDGLVAHGCAIFIDRFPDEPRGGETVPRLAISHQHRRPFA